MNRAIHFKFGTVIADRPFLRKDHKTTPKWAWSGHDPISKFWDPYNFWTNRAICFKFSIKIKDGPFLRMQWRIQDFWKGGCAPTRKI